MRYFLFVCRDGYDMDGSRLRVEISRGRRDQGFGMGFGGRGGMGMGMGMGMGRGGFRGMPGGERSKPYFFLRLLRLILSFSPCAFAYK